MKNKMYVLFLRHYNESYNTEDYKDFFGGVFTSKELANKIGQQETNKYDGWYQYFYVFTCTLNETY